MPIQRPTWLPTYIPELQGLRGLAVLAVVLYHCHPRLEGTSFYRASLWGWAGVNLFFVLSGFLITSILLESRGKPHYFHNFYARRALRIWPVYVLVLVVVLSECAVVHRAAGLRSHQDRAVAGLRPFLQNLFHLALPPAIGPTWSLAIEEQYYFLWAPLVRFLRRPWMLAVAARRCAVGGAAVPPEPLCVDHADAHADSSRRHRAGQPAGDRACIRSPLSRRAWLCWAWPD